METNLFSTFYLQQKHKQLYCSDAVCAYIQYKNFRINLLTGVKEKLGVEVFVSTLNSLAIAKNYENPIVIHLLYEFGFVCVNELNEVDENKPLAICIEYEKAEQKDIVDFLIDKDIDFEALSLPSFKDFEQKFKKTYENLLAGECYQLNLTMPFYFRLLEEHTPREWVNLLWKHSLKIGAYSHVTYIDALGKLFISNSPECLFQVMEIKGKYTVRTMPIKGTCTVKPDESRKLAWIKLMQSKKDEAELFMISDLMRNDLTKINMSPSKVIYKKYPLHVPGLIHQFSLIESELNESQTLGDIVMNLFPGGSITGAPKKNVMGLIKQIENYNRGFYCGSTILLYQKLKTASINIRSAEIDYGQNEIKVGAGGGITLESLAQNEFDEALAKFKSFLCLFKENI